MQYLFHFIVSIYLIQILFVIFVALILLFICLLLSSLFDIIGNLVICAISILMSIHILILILSFTILGFGIVIIGRLFFFLFFASLVICFEPSSLSGRPSLSFVCG